MTTSEQVVAARQRLRMSRKAFSQATGLTESRIWHIEHGKRVPDDNDERALTPVLANDYVPDPAFVATRSTTTRATRPTAVYRTAPPVYPGDLVGFEPAPDLPGDTGASLPIVPTRGAKPEPEAGVRLTSHSELRTFKECRRRWWLAWYRGLKRKEGDSPLGPAAIGSRVHRALRYMYVPNGERPIDPRQALELLIVHDWTALTQGGELSLEFQRKFDQEANLERAMIGGYVQWVVETGEDADLEIIAPETYLEAELPGDFGSQRVKLIGKLDVRARRRTDGQRVFIDHKTVGDFIQPVRMLPLDEQMLQYHLLEFLNTDEGEERCAGALYNMLKKSKRTNRATPPFYQRVSVYHNQHELESYRTRVEGTITDMLDAEEALTQGVNPLSIAYPTPTRDCTWKCPFIQVCPMFDDGSRAEDMLDAYFVRGDTLSYYRNDDVPTEEAS